MIAAACDNRTARFRAKTLEKQRAETVAELAWLETRSDYRPEFAYFLDLFRGDISLATVAQRAGRPAATVLCVQAPLEIFHACGFHPFKIFSGSQAAGQIAASRLPTLVCPMLRSVLGALETETQPADKAAGDFPWIIPTTCDWVVKFPEMAQPGTKAVGKCMHWMELPRLKDSERAGDRWFGEVRALGDFLSRAGGRALNRKTLMQSIDVFKEARQSFSRLIDLRRAGLVPGPWFFLITGSFFLDSVENWTAAVEKTLPCFGQTATAGAPEGGPKGVRIFLAGSPIFFPNFKMPGLMEEAGLLITADDLCSSERIFPANVTVDDPSKDGLLQALAESYHRGCLCPTFGDNDRRINNIKGALPGAGFKGVVFHVLKGCHPYDLESFSLETPLKEAGLRFLRVETDYAVEDSQNILTRLEAFRRTMGE